MGVLVGAGGGLALMGVTVLFVALALLLGAALPLWAGAVIVGGVLCVAGALAAGLGWRQRVQRPLARTTQTLEESVTWAKRI
jgi:hypothetical protein